MTTKLPPSTGSATGRAYWRSLEERAGVPENTAGPERAPAEASELSRRNFIGIMGASFALAGLVGCRKPLARILPYAKRPEDLIPGVPQYYATAWPWRGGAEGVIVESHEGRPTKIEGNPDQSQSLGATGSYAQAAILSLYDPDRSMQVRRGEDVSDWNAFRIWSAGHFGKLRAARGRGLRVLSAVSSSPFLNAEREKFQRAFPEAVWHHWEPVNRDHALAGARIAFGRPLRPQIDFSRAEVIVSLDGDFLGVGPNAVAEARGFARGRRVTDEHRSMNRLYVVENGYSITGAMADHRLRLAHGRIADFAAALGAKLLNDTRADLPGLDPSALRTAAVGAHWNPDEIRWMDAVTRDLLDHRGRAVLVAGERQPAEVHALVYALNQALGSIGPVMRFTEDPDPGDQLGSIRDLAGALESGSVDTLLVFGVNPAYDAPADLGFDALLAKAGTVIHHGFYRDETSVGAAWHLPEAHFLESWGDARAWDGQLSLQQPLIEPLYGGKNEAEVTAMILTGEEPDAHRNLQTFYRKKWGRNGFEARWDRALNDGVIPDSGYDEIPVRAKVDAVNAVWRGRVSTPAPTRDAMEVVFHQDYKLYDGRFANSGWLQELPDPMTKLTWDNPALMSPRTARELGVGNEDLVRVSVGGRELTLPVWIVPGRADFTLGLALGYGRRTTGRVGTGAGFDTYRLRTTTALDAAFGVKVTPAGGTYPLASTQNHDRMENRPIYREATLEHYREHPDFAEHMEESPPPSTLYTDREYDFDEGNQWGMSIDLNTCTGCNACVTACQSENNIAIVGKDQVIRGREMHWIRLDRYYVGDEDSPEAVQQPVVCQQCENAPCESVCPVNATSHSADGLNDMVYNRCIGTRYCSNNCPYKVRRFNFYDWNKEMTSVEKMGKNPNVTVRMRGVMEKCTYCIQRISTARIAAKNRGEPIADGEIVTACQQVCPTESIVFGDVNDPNTRVSRLKEQERDYTMLKWLNTKPRTTYLARLRNPNPELENA